MSERKEIELEREFEYMAGNVTLVATAHYDEKGENCYDKIIRLLKEESQRKAQ